MYIALPTEKGAWNNVTAEQIRHTHYDQVAHDPMWKSQKDSLETHVKIKNKMS